MKPRDKTGNVTATMLRSVLEYDPLSGIFKWKSLPSSNVSNINIGDIAGWIENTGYARITLFGRKYTAHRLAWLYVYGQWPQDKIDHRDGCKSNNRIINLRQANDSMNKANSTTYKNNKLGFKGIEMLPSGKYRTRITVNGKRIPIGSYSALEEAIASYAAAAKQHFGEFARVK